MTETKRSLHAPEPEADGTPAASPFHEGEQRIQTGLGVRDEIEPWARRVVRSYLPEEHRAFYSQLPFLVLAARDSAGRPWATLLAEEPGFVSSPDPRTLRIAALPSPGDALSDGLQSGDDIGLLGIELHTRRRNRVNGQLAGREAGGFVLSVEQGFGNCPQYITQRRWRRAPSGTLPGRATRASSLSAGQRELIQRADTFFIATGFRASGESEVFGMDASHRGGAPGFVRIAGTSEIVFPDYAGNNHFNTLGNLVMDPRAGLLFVDFERGDLLQLTGRARIDWDSREIERFPGARRLVHFKIDEVVSLERAFPLRFEAEHGAVRELRVIGKERESADVTSFLFASRDGSPLAGFVAGQHLPVELEVPGEAAPVLRTYSLSGAPGDPHYRISVKREPLGLASRYLHDHLETGEFISAGAPEGAFTLDSSSKRPAVLVSAGVGLTPLVSMLHALAHESGGRRTWFVHGARDGDHHPLRREVEHLARSASNVQLHVVYSQPRRDDVIGRDYHSEGRADGALLEKLVPGLEADFYLCGPIGFMAAIQSQLEAHGVPTGRIHTESFGPVA
ncbi:MAG: pyridoxamine 5'-phosphate oxidase family protein [Deltaproteobacteria bacterium]|nr:pyridoxamine 5'-phosphate oxidase family protein [Deltaproteobacteria bacterium]